MQDLISRQAAIDALDALCDRECEYSKKQRSVMCGACHLGSAFDIIEQLPTAESRKGKWVLTDFPDEQTYKCSACNEIWTFIVGTPEDNGAFFCPNCGADMRGEQDE